MAKKYLNTPVSKSIESCFDDWEANLADRRSKGEFSERRFARLQQFFSELKNLIDHEVFLTDRQVDHVMSVAMEYAKSLLTKESELPPILRDVADFIFSCQADANIPFDDNETGRLFLPSALPISQLIELHRRRYGEKGLNFLKNLMELVRPDACMTLSEHTQWQTLVLVRANATYILRQGIKRSLDLTMLATVANDTRHDCGRCLTLQCKMRDSATEEPEVQ